MSLCFINLMLLVFENIMKNEFENLVHLPDSIDLVDVPDSDAAFRLIERLRYRRRVQKPKVDPDSKSFFDIFNDPRKFAPRREAYLIKREMNELKRLHDPEMLDATGGLCYNSLSLTGEDYQRSLRYRKLQKRLWKIEDTYGTYF